MLGLITNLINIACVAGAKRGGVGGGGREKSAKEGNEEGSLLPNPPPFSSLSPPPFDARYTGYINIGYQLRY